MFALCFNGAHVKTKAAQPTSSMCSGIHASEGAKRPSSSSGPTSWHNQAKMQVHVGAGHVLSLGARAARIHLTLNGAGHGVEFAGSVHSGAMIARNRGVVQGPVPLTIVLCCSTSNVSSVSLECPTLACLSNIRRAKNQISTL